MVETTPLLSEDEVPEAEAGPSFLTRLFGISALGPFIALILVGAFFALKSDRFLTGGNLSLVLQQTIEVGTLAIGQTLIILTAGIDLSNGAIMAFGSIVMTKLVVDHTVSPVVGIALGILTCGAFGLANGLLVTIV